MEYIDKSALVAEIKRRINAYQKNFDKADNKIAKLFADGLIQGLESFLAFLDTFEVKEVDLDREMQAFAFLYLEPLKISDSNIGISITMSQLYSCAKHFFELGIKAQKGE